MTIAGLHRNTFERESLFNIIGYIKISFKEILLIHLDRFDG